MKKLDEATINEVLGPIVPINKPGTINCLCGETKPHMHNVSNNADIQRWHETGVINDTPRANS